MRYWFPLSLLLIAGLLWFAGCSNQTTLAALQAKQAKVQSYKMTVTGAKDQKGQAFVGVMKFRDGQVVKAKMEIPDGNMLIDKDKHMMYMYNQKLNAAMSMPYTESANVKKVTNPLSELTKEISPETKITRTDAVDGVKCWVYENPHPVNTSGITGKATLYIDQHTGLLRQVIDDESTIKLAYDQLNSVPDSEFELPAGAKVMTQEEMMQGMGRRP